MRVSIEIDDQLLREAMKITGCRSKKDVVEKGLKRLVFGKKKPRILKLKGSGVMRPDYDYKEMRKLRTFTDDSR